LLRVYIDPNNERVVTNKELYETLMKEKQQEQQQHDGPSGDAVFVNKNEVQVSKDFVNYERLCRGEDTHVSILTSASYIMPP